MNQIPTLDLTDLSHSEQRAAMDELGAFGTIGGIYLPSVALKVDYPV